MTTIPSTAEAKLEMLTTINRAIAGSRPEALPPYPVPAPLSRAEILHQFEDRILDYGAAYTHVSAAELPGAIAKALGNARRVIVPAGIPAPSAWTCCATSRRCPMPNSTGPTPC